MVRRIAGLVLLLLFFGQGMALAAQHYGERYPATGSVGAVIFSIVMGMYAIFMLWSTSKFVYAKQLAIAMTVVVLLVFPLRLLITHVTWFSFLRCGLMILGGLVLAFGTGTTDADTPIARFRARNEARNLPRLNRHREKRGQAPVASFQEARDEIPPERRRRARWRGGFTAAIVVLNFGALLNDPGHVGEHASAADYPFGVLLALSLFMAGLVVGAWWFSDFKYRTVVSILELVLDFGVMVLFITGRRTTITIWDVVEDVVWLILANLQMFGRGREETVTER